MTASNRTRGQQAEEVACAYLEAAGLRLKARNFRCRSGEIDLIMEDGGQLVFVEVRYRRDARFGSGAESVTPKKRQRVQRAAAYYLHRAGLSDQTPCRFDVAALTAPLETAEVEWIRNAF